MNLDEMFPETIFVEQWKAKYGDTKALRKQLEVIGGEVLEVQEAFFREHYNKAIEELVDVMQAASTAMRMIPGYDPKIVEDMVEKVRIKNTERGYIK